MPSFHLRFVGQDTLPKSLSQADIEEGFSLSDHDVEQIRSRFRGPGRLGAADQLVVLRATGRAADAVVGLPKALLQSLSKAVGIRGADIASVRTLYKRRETRFDHQRWAREHAGFALTDAGALIQLDEVLGQLSNSAVSVDDLVKQGELWLYGRQYVLPGDRLLLGRRLQRRSRPPWKLCAKGCRLDSCMWHLSARSPSESGAPVGPYSALERRWCDIRSLRKVRHRSPLS